MRFGVSDLVFGFWGFGVGVLCFEFGVQEFGLRVSGFGFGVEDLQLTVEGLECRVSGFRFKVTATTKANSPREHIEKPISSTLNLR